VSAASPTEYEGGVYLLVPPLPLPLPLASEDLPPELNGPREGLVPNVLRWGVISEPESEPTLLPPEAPEEW
jgi:hypothetical protein